MSFLQGRKPRFRGPRGTLVGVAFVLALGIVACVARDDDAGEDEAAVSAAARTIPVNRLVEDGDIEGGEAITVEEVQSFLIAKGSALAGFSEDGRTAATWIVDESRAEGISPLYMLARLQTESRIITSGTLDNIAKATGCGCPDSSACNPQFANFGPQVRCAAQKIRGYLRSLDTVGHTVSGWSVGLSKTTSDPCIVIPENRATAAFYTYTPWVGAYGVDCGTERWGGSSLVARILRSYKASFPSEAEPDAGDGGAEVGVPDGMADAEVDKAPDVEGRDAAPGWFDAAAY
jgi:hypothetical protein